MLIYNVKERSCSFRISESTGKNIIVIGDFIFDAFAMEYDLENRILKMHRLDNNWSKYYDANRKHTQGSEYGYFLGFVYFLFVLIWYVFKFIFFLAILSILINCYYRRDQLFDWFAKILSRMRHKRAQRLKKNYEEDKDRLFK